MSYNPTSTHLDFEDFDDYEIGSLGSKLKKGLQKAKKGLDKVTNATIVKPSAAIGGAIGGKKGRALGEKLGKITAGVTKFGVAAGAAGAAAPILTHVAPVVATGMVAKKVASKGGLNIGAKIGAALGGGGKAEADASGDVGASGSASGSVSFPGFMGKSKKKPSSDNQLAAKVAADLVAKLGGPLSEANKALRLAELQRTATYEHKKLMGDAEFRKKVLAGIAAMGARGNCECQRTVKVLVGRS